jgi:hypothetical protein
MHRLLLFEVIMLKIILTALFALGGLGLAQLSLPGLPGLPSSLPSLPSLPTVPALPSVTGANAYTPNNQGSSDYRFLTNTFTLPDLRVDQIPNARMPYLELTNFANLRTYLANGERCRKEEAEGKGYSDPSLCPQFEWSVPMSTEDASRDAAKDLRKAWQRLEDRYYWNAMVRLNNPAYYAAFCWVNWSGGVDPARPETKITLRAADLEPSLRSKIPQTEPDPQLYLDSYFPLPQVDNKDFCDGVNFELLPIMFIPGFCVAFYNVDIICTPDYPKPIWFNQDAANQRILAAIESAHTTYLIDYLTDTLKALTPAEGGRLLFPLPWRSNLPNDGAFIAPIFNLDVNPQQFVELGNQATQIYGGLEGANATAYYLQSAVRSPSLDWHSINRANDLSQAVPGVWRLEELKRLLKPTNPLFYERIGYSSFFQAWNDQQPTVLPEPAWAKVLRPLVYWAVGVRVNFEPLFGCGVCSSVTPTAVPVAPYLLPYAGPRMKWTWVSVPEGYQIPRVKGLPLFDYRPLLRTEANK